MDEVKISIGKRTCLRLSDSRRYLNNGPVSASNASLLIILMTIVRKAKIRKDKLITEYDYSLIYIGTGVSITNNKYDIGKKNNFPNSICLEAIYHLSVKLIT